MTLPYLGLRPTQSGYSTSEREEAVLMQPLQGGPARYRRDMLDATSMAKVRWSLRKARYDQLMAFYRTATVRGSLPFEVDLILDGPGLTRHEAYFVPGSLRLDGIDGGKYVVVADLEVYPADVDEAVDAAIVELAELYGGVDGLGAMLGALDDLVNAEFPEL